MTKASIITVAFNSGETIAKTIESVLNQTKAPYEYIIIDGKSKDHTVDIAMSYQEAFQGKGIEYKIISEPDHGIYDAMNKGIRLSTGDIVGIINSDDWYELNAVEVVSKTFETTGCDLCWADLRICNGDRQMIKHAKISKWVTTRHWNHPTTFIKRMVYEKDQYRCICIYDDWDFILRARKSGYKMVAINTILANFQFGGISNEKSFKKMLQRIQLKYGIYRKNGYSPVYWMECALIEFVKYIFS